MKQSRKLSLFSWDTKHYYIDIDSRSTIMNTQQYISIWTDTISVKSIALVELDEKDSKEKSLAYAKSMWPDEYKFIEQRQNKNDTFFPIHKIDLLSTNWLFLYFKKTNDESKSLRLPDQDSSR